MIKKYKFEIIFGVFIVVLYCILRFYHILNLPIFTDEAIYIRWSQIAKQDANWRFISLTDGKQPMFVWIAIILLKFIHDPLLGGRMVSVFAGFASTIGLFFLGKELFKNRWIGLLTSCIYVVYPFGLVYDRMALYDSLVAAFAVWGWYITILLVKKIRSDIPFVLGLVLGGGMLTKTSDFFIAALLPVSLLLFDFKQKHWIKELLKWTCFAGLAVLLAFLYYSIVRLSPFYTIIDEKNAIFVYPFNEWIRHPFTFFGGNIKGLFDWVITYMKIPLFLLIIVSFLFYKEYTREKLLLLIWFLAPFFYLAFFGNTLYPRFIFFMTMPLLVLAAYALYKITGLTKNLLIKGIIVLFFLLFSMHADYFILNDFAHAPIPQSDLGQYSNDWPAGGGIREATEFFQQKAKQGKIYLATEGTFGLMPYSFEIYLVTNPNIKIQGLWPINDTIPKELITASKKMPVYIVFYQPCPPCKNTENAPITWPVHLIARYKKGIGEKYLSIYEVNK